MIRSMTAFASGERTTPWGTLGCELRAVNHRFRSLGLTSSNADQLSCRAWRATKVIRQGLCPIFCGARTAEKPAWASFSIISFSP